MSNVMVADTPQYGSDYRLVSVRLYLHVYLSTTMVPATVPRISVTSVSAMTVSETARGVAERAAGLRHGAALRILRYKHCIS